MRYLDPKNDLTFKKVFGEHPHLLRSFLNAMLPLEPGREVVSLEYLSPEMVPDLPAIRNSLVDVRCRDNHGRQFIVEMQMLWTESFQQRVLFNASKAYVKQLRPGQEYRLLQPVYSLALLNESYLPDADQWYHHYRIVEVAGTGQAIEGLEFVFVELPKFTPQTLTEKRLMALWLRFLTEVGHDSGEVPPELTADRDLREAVELLRESAFSPDELAAYENYWDRVSIERSVKSDAWLEGRAEGHAEGHAEGKAEGERIARAQLVRSLHANGLASKKIAELTGMSEADLSMLLGE